ncbi:hypothetical protein J2S43_002605 [Catenuloplanes nepalensis]|uniref:Uncharacterized protein n=1 Tax=Catenuloplanes nepalensis TaxID=587533 RepID=A0ABT9MRN0_9ACTN|nr:hypothetical protein [Catenuloplanes nepalensis]MDP9794093.1 hypothetical protein [Catenuloplanes nepalensis]
MASPSLRALGAVSLAAALVLLAGAPAAAASPASPLEAASARAEATGQRVEVVSERTESSRVYAEPSGLLTLEASVNWYTGSSGWAYASSDNSAYASTSAPVGYNESNGLIYRSFFTFPAGALAGATVQNAYVQMLLEHSWSCTPTPATMWSAGALTGTPRTAWATPLQNRLATVSANANSSGACGSPQPRTTVNFAGSPVLGWIQTAATAGATDVTAGFSAAAADGTGENTVNRWKRFSTGDARLIVSYEPPVTR